MNKKKPALFLDRDGTIIEERGYLSRPSEVFFFPGTIPALKLLAEQFTLFVVTNQSGVGEGFIKYEDTRTVNNFIKGRLAKQGINIEKFYTCPHAKDEGCICRKPSPHFICMAKEDYNIDLSRSFTVGDHPCDVELAINAGAQPVFLLSGHGQKHLEEIPPSVPVAKDIGEAARLIIARLKTLPGEDVVEQPATR